MKRVLQHSDVYPLLTLPAEELLRQFKQANDDMEGYGDSTSAILGSGKDAETTARKRPFLVVRTLRKTRVASGDR